MSHNAIGIPSDQLTLIRDTLTSLLNEEYGLYRKTLAYHWNVSGPHFTTLHALFEEHYTWLASLQDEIAERLKMLGFTATLPSQASDEQLADTADAMVADLLKTHQQLACSLRNSLKTLADTDDFITQDLLTSTLASHEKNCWVLHAHAS